jgi:uncharacterized membrane protein
MATVSRAVHIAAPKDRVFALVADPAKLVGTDSRIGRVDVERDATGPRRVRMQFAPGAAPSAAGTEIVADVTRYNPDTDFAVASPPGAQGPAFRLEVTCRDADGGTDVTCEMEVRLPGMGGRLADPLIAAALTQQVAALLARVEREATRPVT